MRNSQGTESHMKMRKIPQDWYNKLLYQSWAIARLFTGIVINNPGKKSRISAELKRLTLSKEMRKMPNATEVEVFT